jgi:hypothetical protein
MTGAAGGGRAEWATARFAQSELASQLVHTGVSARQTLLSVDHVIPAPSESTIRIAGLHSGLERLELGESIPELHACAAETLVGVAHDLRNLGFCRRHG